jgi:hypothetical protein
LINSGDDRIPSGRRLLLEGHHEIPGVV